MYLAFDSWVQVKDGDREAFALFERHYTFYRYADGRRDDPKYRQRFLFVGPGEKLVLLTPDGTALFAWRKFLQPSPAGEGVCCCVFRNEGSQLSSDLILAAEVHAWERWPGERLFTHVNPRKVQSSNPGFCFLKAGWCKSGVTKRRQLLTLEKLPTGG